MATTKNNNTSADAEMNGYLASLATPGKFYFVISDLPADDISEGDAWTDISGDRIGTETLFATSLTCVNRLVDCGALTFAAVAGGSVRSIVVLTKAPASSPLVYIARSLYVDGAAYDMDTKGPLYINNFTIKKGWNGET